jgi:hypothetical protein
MKDSMLAESDEKGDGLSCAKTHGPERVLIMTVSLSFSAAQMQTEIALKYHSDASQLLQKLSKFISHPFPIQSVYR